MDRAWKSEITSDRAFTLAFTTSTIFLDFRYPDLVQVGESGEDGDDIRLGYDITVVT